MNEDDFIALLRRAVKDAGNQKAWATRHGVSPQYVNDVLKRRRSPGETICRPLRIERVVSYRRTKEKNNG